MKPSPSARQIPGTSLGTTCLAWYNAAAMQQEQPTSPSRVLVIGLDGATWSIAEPLIAAGRMPTLARLVAEGTAGSLASTVPPISAAAWVSFLTGQNPGRHGVYQFRKLDMRQYGGYRDEFATSHDYAGRSFLELVGQRGRSVGSIGVPMTYPPFPVNGFLVSGFPRPFGPQAHVYPPEMAAELGRWDAVQDSFNFSLSAQATVETSDYWVRKYTDIAQKALGQDRYDLFLVVWNSTDNIPHLFWKYTDPSYPAYDAAGAREFGEVINHQYEVADGEMGRLLAALPDAANTTVLVMSDHGMGAYPHRQVNFNAWLAGQGLLTCKAGAGSQPSLANRTISQLRKRLANPVAAAPALATAGRRAGRSVRPAHESGPDRLGADSGLSLEDLSLGGRHRRQRARPPAAGRSRVGRCLRGAARSLAG